MGLSCFKSWKHDSGGNKGNRDVLASPGSYFFLSNSAGQGDEWLKSLNKGVWIPFTGVFGQRLEETVLYERRYGMRLVPLIVEQCVTFIRRHGLHEDGLFRLPGQAGLVEALQEAFDSGERPSFDGNTDVHTVASLLRLYLRQLPEPLVPYARHHDFLLCGQKLLSDRPQGLGELRGLLCELPFANFNLLNFICQFLFEVQSCSGSNRTSVQNLAAVFGPNILRAKAEDPPSTVGGAPLVQVLMLELIREHETLFAKAPPHGAARLPGGSRPPPDGAPPPCGRQLSLPLISGSAGPPGRSPQDASSAKSDVPPDRRRLRGHRYTSSHPEDCFYPRPSSSQSARDPRPGTDYWSPAARRPSPNGARAPARCWEPAWTGPGEGFSGFWSPGGAEEAASGGSSEAQEDSTLSTYDNLQQGPEVAAGALDPGARPGSPGEKKRSPSWSSCEILPLDEGEGATDLGMSPEGDPGPEDGGRGDGEGGEGGACRPPSPASCSAPSDSPLSTGSSDVFLPSAPADLQDPGAPTPPADARSLLSRLQEEMAHQRAEYQAKILRLERCNDILKHQIAVLRISLEQQKRSQSVAEVRIRNMERDRADADLRNAALQREMELFFQKYGRLKREGVAGGGGGGSL